MEEKEYNFALLIDTENVTPKYYDIIANELEELGTIKIKRAYGDFSSNNPWKEKSISEGIMPVQAFAQIKGKNTTDLVMVIDAMDLFYSGDVDAFCLATSDSDFARLAQRLKEGGKYVVVAGKETTPVSLSKSSNRFIMLDKLYETQNIETKQVKNPNEQRVTAPKVPEIKAIVDEIIANNMAPDGWTLFSTIVNQLEKRYPQFNYKTYKAKNKRDFFISNLGCEFKQDGTIVSLRMKK